jgi:hypothetical protein
MSPKYSRPLHYLLFVPFITVLFTILRILHQSFGVRLELSEPLQLLQG